MHRRPFDRRTFLKFFGTGATVLPVVNGVPVAEAAGAILSPPKIEPVNFRVQSPAAACMKGLQLRPVFITVEIWSYTSPPDHIRFKAQSFITHAKVQPIDVTTSADTYSMAIPGPRQCRFTIEGICTEGSPDIQRIPT